ncbi:MAG: hypothetical protein ACRDI1_05400, partial [Actinomycetota bacterium]
IAPGGLSGIAFGLRDGLYRIIAQRRRMVVPSLFADLDPAEMLRQLAPLAEPVPNSGLGALPVNLRYRTTSWLYGTRGKVDGAERRAAAEAQAFEAAADRIEDVGTVATTPAVPPEEIPSVAEEPAARATDEAGEVAAEVATGPTKGEDE